MKTFTQEQLTEILDKHEAWLNNEEGSERADLIGAYLRDADLIGAYLRDADLIGAYLRDADLKGANLRNADLRGANLRDANLRDANLRNADLRGANLRDANLRDADLKGANLRDADLSGADLKGAYLRDANLIGAYLSGADLKGAVGNMIELKSIQSDAWPITYTAEAMQIGCQRHAINEWWAFNDEEISAMDSEALGWWAVWKPILQTIIAASPAVATQEGK